MGMDVAKMWAHRVLRKYLNRNLDFSSPLIQENSWIIAGCSKNITTASYCDDKNTRLTGELKGEFTDNYEIKPPNSPTGPTSGVGLSVL